MTAFKSFDFALLLSARNTTRKQCFGIMPHEAYIPLTGDGTHVLDYLSLACYFVFLRLFLKMCH